MRPWLTLLTFACAPPSDGPATTDVSDETTDVESTDPGGGTDTTDPTDPVTDPVTDPATDPDDTDATDPADPTDEDTDPPPSESVEIGNGQAAHAPLAAGASVVMVQGGQGAWHIWGSARVCGLGSRVRHTAQVYDVQTGTYIGGLGMSQPDLKVSSLLSMEPDGRCGTIVGLFGYLMDPSPLADGEADRAPEVSSGCATQITMQFWTADLAKTASASVDVVAVPDPVNVGTGNNDGKFMIPDLEGPRVGGVLGRCW